MEKTQKRGEGRGTEAELNLRRFEKQNVLGSWTETLTFVMGKRRGR